MLALWHYGTMALSLWHYCPLLAMIAASATSAATLLARRLGRRRCRRRVMGGKVQMQSYPNNELIKLTGTPQFTPLPPPLGKCSVSSSAKASVYALRTTHYYCLHVCMSACLHVCTSTRCKRNPACVVGTSQPPSLMVTTLVAKVKRFPQNPRVPVAPARCRDADASTSLGSKHGTRRDEKTLFTTPGA